LIRSIPWVRRYNQREPVYQIPVQTRLSVHVTVILLIAGLVVFWILEADNVLAEKPILTQFWISAFQSVTCRTAGFSTVPMDQLQPTTVLLLIALMVVGACPGSTGGGIKTVTFAVLLLALRQRFRVNLVAIKRMAAGPEGGDVVKEFKAVPMPEDVIQAGDVLALAGSVLDLARFVSDNSK
jgi:Trk-type K+ transport system membrane component